jgi:alkylhydroperoxidase family enzyme
MASEEGDDHGTATEPIRRGARSDSPLYSERERAALAWTEALTLVSETHAPDDVYRALQAQFTEKEQVMLTLLIVAINGWNRIQIGFRAVHPLGQPRVA